MRFVFCQDCPNQLQSAALRALAAMPGVEVTLSVEDARIPDWRIRMGWQPVDFGTVSVVEATHSSIRALIKSCGPNDVAIFSGYGAFATIREGIAAAISSPVIMGIMSEARVGLGLKGRLRRLASRVDAWKLSERVDFLLAIGTLGVNWYRQAGFPGTAMFPYGYFVERPMHPVIERGDAAGPIRLIYVGQLVYRKGVDVLLRALANMRDLDWSLAIVGDGPERLKLERFAQDANINGRVQFKGALAHVEALHLLAASDVLLLPSRWDGWGAVVNEALMRGVQVVCSSNCGAADLICSPRQGAVFRANDALALEVTLRQAIRRVTATNSKRDLAKWAERLDGSVAAKYLMAVAQWVQAQRAGDFSVRRPDAVWSTESPS